MGRMGDFGDGVGGLMDSWGVQRMVLIINYYHTGKPGAGRTRKKGGDWMWVFFWEGANRGLWKWSVFGGDEGGKMKYTTTKL